MPHPNFRTTGNAPRLRRRMLSLTAALSIASLTLAGCSAPQTAAGSSDSVVNTQISSETSTFFNNEKVHEITVDVDQASVDKALTAYEKDQAKEWISANVTIDGNEFKNVGLRLKGNSTLRQADTSSDPADLPWQIRLDKFVDGQSYSGRSQFVIRTNNSETSLNEAVALELLGEAGLATENAAATRFTFNDSKAQLRLVIDNPSDELYSEETFKGEGITYKADSTGNYSYRGKNGSDYESAFSVEAGAEDLTPIAQFLDFVNNSSDEDFASQLGQKLDVEQFATYLAMQDLVANSDDIDGPGNNSFLRYDNSSGAMTVVAWDQNLSFGSMGSMGRPDDENTRRDGQFPGGADFSTNSMLKQFLPEGTDLDSAKKEILDGNIPSGAAAPQGMKLQEGTELIEVLKSLAEGKMPSGISPEGMQIPQGGTPGGQDGQQNQDGSTSQRPTGQGPSFGSKSNTLVTRFLENDDFKAQVDDTKKQLFSALFESGKAQEILDRWSSLLTSEASDLVDAKTIASEAEKIKSFFTEQASSQPAEQPAGAAGS